MVRLAALKKDTKTMLQYAEHTLADSYWMLVRILEQVTVYLRVSAKDYDRALFYHKLYRRLLAIFDDGGDDFCATDKIFECEEAAGCHMLKEDREHCLEELKRCMELAEKVLRVAKSEDFHLSKRNRYFTNLTEEDDYEEEYMADVYPDRLLAKYAGFLSGNEEFEAMKNQKI